jgi:hypothetical protein
MRQASGGGLGESLALLHRVCPLHVTLEAE